MATTPPTPDRAIAQALIGNTADAFKPAAPEADIQPAIPACPGRNFANTR